MKPTTPSYSDYSLRNNAIVKLRTVTEELRGKLPTESSSGIDTLHILRFIDGSLHPESHRLIGVNIKQFRDWYEMFVQMCTILSQPDPSKQ